MEMNNKKIKQNSSTKSENSFLRVHGYLEEGT